MATGPDAGSDPGPLRTRTYGDGCAAAHALDIIGERWAMLIARELLFGPKRFTDLQAGLHNASPNVLSQRLRELERSRVIRRRRLGPPARAWVYDLTEWGRDLAPILVQLGHWGARSPFLNRDADVGPDSLMVALQSHFDPGKSQDLVATYLIGLGDDVFTARVTEGRLEISRGEPDAPDVTVSTDSATFRALIIEGKQPGRTSRDGHLEITGDTGAFNRLLDAVAHRN